MPALSPDVTSSSLIGTRAREGMELLLGSKVFLDLRVRVEREWQRDPKAFDRLGL